MLACRQRKAHNGRVGDRRSVLRSCRLRAVHSPLGNAHGRHSLSYSPIRKSSGRSRGVSSPNWRLWPCVGPFSVIYVKSLRIGPALPQYGPMPSRRLFHICQLFEPSARREHSATSAQTGPRGGFNLPPIACMSCLSLNFLIRIKATRH